MVVGFVNEVLFTSDKNQMKPNICLDDKTNNPTRTLKFMFEHMIIYRFKMMPNRVRLETFFKVFGQNMSIKTLNSMLSKVSVKKIECKKV